MVGTMHTEGRAVTGLTAVMVAKLDGENIVTTFDPTNQDVVLLEHIRWSSVPMEEFLARNPERSFIQERYPEVTHVLVKDPENYPSWQVKVLAQRRRVYPVDLG